jgi:hypothetical protein
MAGLPGLSKNWPGAAWPPRRQCKRKLDNPQSQSARASLKATAVLRLASVRCIVACVVFAVTPLFSGLLPSAALGGSDIGGPAIASTYGADVSGTADATAALSKCLAAATAGGTCTVDRGGTVKVLSDLTIPAQTTLDCGATFTDMNNNLTGPAIHLDPAHSIRFGGTQAAIHNCLIIPDSMTFPQSDSGGWRGTAISTQGYASPEIVNTEIVGFDTCVNAYNSGRILIRRNVLDCTGSTEGSLVTGGESDSGFVEDLKLQVVGTLATCPARMRRGIGWYWHNATSGGVFADNVVAQDFQTADYYFSNVNNLLAGTLWADFASADGCPRGQSVGVLWDSINNAHVSHLDLNGVQTGLLLKGNQQHATNTIDDLMLNGIGEDCIVVTAAGHLNISSLHTNQTTAGNCGRYAVNYNDKQNASFVSIAKGTLTGVHGGTSPYVYTAYAASPGWQLQLGAIVSDLPPGSPLVGGAVLPGPQTIASGTTLALRPGQCSFMCTVSGINSITAISGVSPGDTVTLQFQAAMRVVNGNNIRLSGKQDFVTQSGSLLRMICNSLDGVHVTCTEMSRSF